MYYKYLFFSVCMPLSQIHLGRHVSHIAKSNLFCSFRSILFLLSPNYLNIFYFLLFFFLFFFISFRLVFHYPLSFYGFLTLNAFTPLYFSKISFLEYSFPFHYAVWFLCLRFFFILEPHTSRIVFHLYSLVFLSDFYFVTDSWLPPFFGDMAADFLSPLPFLFIYLFLTDFLVSL